MPRSRTRYLSGGNIQIQTVGQREWKGKTDGALLKVAQHQYQIDQGIPHQKNIARFDISIVPN